MRLIKGRRMDSFWLMKEKAKTISKQKRNLKSFKRKR
jgi:hypothetical protein